MGTIKDVIDLIVQLSRKVKDRKFAEELRQIQSMIGDIQSEQAVLHEKRMELISENADLKNEIISLKQKICESSIDSSTNTNELSEEAKKILMFLTQHDEVTSRYIASNLSIHKTKAEYWLGELSSNEYVYYPLMIGNSEKYYSLCQKGREYLVKNDLIK